MMFLRDLLLVWWDKVGCLVVVVWIWVRSKSVVDPLETLEITWKGYQKVYQDTWNLCEVTCGLS